MAFDESKKTIKSGRSNLPKTSAATDRMVNYLDKTGSRRKSTSINWLRNRVKNYNQHIDAVDPVTGAKLNDEVTCARLTAKRELVYTCLKMYQAARLNKDEAGEAAATRFALLNGIELQDDSANVFQQSSLTRLEKTPLKSATQRVSEYVRTPGSVLRRSSAIEYSERAIEDTNADMEAVLESRRNRS